MKRRRNNKVKISSMYCTLCGNRGIPIPRTGTAREQGHLKKIYCLYCDKETNHCEIKPYGSYTLEDFRFEFENHNFDENGNRKHTYGELKTFIHNHDIDKYLKFNL